VTTGCLTAERIGDGEQHDTVVDGVQAVAGAGDGEVIAAATIPAASVEQAAPPGACTRPHHTCGATRRLDVIMHIRMMTCVCACYHAVVPKTVQIRDIDDEIYAALVRRAAEEGITVPELLRREAARLASRHSVAQWLARTGRRPSEVSTTEVLATLDEWRGEWPNADR
jgi:cobalamin biosynthesis protein CobT